MMINKLSSFNATMKTGFYTVNTVLHTLLHRAWKVTLQNTAHTTGLTALTIPIIAIYTISFQGITEWKHNSIQMK